MAAKKLQPTYIKAILRGGCNEDLCSICDTLALTTVGPVVILCSLQNQVCGTFFCTVSTVSVNVSKFRIILKLKILCYLMYF